MPLLLLLLFVAGCVFDASGVRSDSGVVLDSDAALIDAFDPDASAAPSSDASSPDAEVCQGYVVESIALSWHAAEGDCFARGWHLAVVDNAADNMAIRELTSGPIHIGLHFEEGAFVWQDGSALTYTNWADGQPSGEDCVQMGSAGTWYDADCGGALPYVCEC